MKKILLSMIAVVGISASVFAQSNSDHINFGVGTLFYERIGCYLSWGHETKYHNAYLGILFVSWLLSQMG